MSSDYNNENAMNVSINVFWIRGPKKLHGNMFELAAFSSDDRM